MLIGVVLGVVKNVRIFVETILRKYSLKINKNPGIHNRFRGFAMEAAGIEPASENRFTEHSPSADGYFHSLLPA